MADIGNIIGGYFTQFIIKKGIPIPKARKIALVLSGVFMAVPLLIAPFIITTPMSGLIVFGLSGFGYTSYTANALALTADVIPKSSAASAWGLACIGNGIGGAIFQSISGLTLKGFSKSLGYVSAYNILFLGFGVLVVIGMLILIFLSGSFDRNKELYEYADGDKQILVA
jgi:ACS family hexuronate transporter-like MFS transporter